MPDRTVESTALYAGETVARLHDVIPAAQVVDELTTVGEQVGRAVDD
jgi:hypothetical protein